MDFYNIAPIEVLKLINKYKIEMDDYIKHKKLLKKIHKQLLHCNCNCSDKSIEIENDYITKNKLTNCIYKLDSEGLNVIKYEVDSELFFHYRIFDSLKYVYFLTNIFDKYNKPFFNSDYDYDSEITEDWDNMSEQSSMDNIQYDDYEE